jgi:hypothetical protein
LNQDIADVLFTDASDAPQRLGAETSAIYDNLKWALEVKRVLDNGLDATCANCKPIAATSRLCPTPACQGICAAKRRRPERLSERLGKEDFYKHTADFNSQLTHLKGRVRDAVITLSDQQKLRLKEGVEDSAAHPRVGRTHPGRARQRREPAGWAWPWPATQDLAGLKKLLARDYDINSTLDDLKRSIQRQGQERLRQRMEEERAKTGEKGPGQAVQVGRRARQDDLGGRTRCADSAAPRDQGAARPLLGDRGDLLHRRRRRPVNGLRPNHKKPPAALRQRCAPGAGRRVHPPAAERLRLDPNAGTSRSWTSLRHINDAQRETARILRDTLAHYTASGDMNTRQGLDRIVREQAFTVLNRLAALRMAEARGCWSSRWATASRPRASNSTRAWPAPAWAKRRCLPRVLVQRL